MNRRAALVWSLSLAAAALFGPLPAASQAPPDARTLIAAEARALQPLSGFDGVWRGPSRVTTADGRSLTLTQTERVGPFLDGSLKVIEGRGYATDGAEAGTTVFNAFGVVSFSPQTGRYQFRASAQGYTSDFPMEVSQDRFVWTIQAGPATIRYTASVHDGVWFEIGERLVEGQPPVRIHEMTLRRVGDTDWPAAGAVPPR